MMEENNKNVSVFKYNMSFYYQSTIIYFVVFALYVIIRGEFVEDSYTLITKDPILYFFALIVVISVLSLLYNLFKNRHLEITDDAISFVDRFGTKTYNYNQFLSVKISKRKRENTRRAFRLVRIRLKTRKRPLIIRPIDYENSSELLERFKKIKMELEKR